MTIAALELQSIEFSWAQQPKPLFAIAELTLQQGETLFIGGPSGCGKTSLLSLITGIQVPQHGTCKVLGTAMNQLSPSDRDRFRGEHLGLIFQQFNLLPFLTVQENIELPSKLFDRRFKKSTELFGSVQAHVDRLCDALHLEPALRHRRANLLSVGEQQRVAAARALLGCPSLIVADEPTSALDEDNKIDFLNLLLSTASAQKTSVITVSHDMRIASKFDRVFLMPRRESQHVLA
jgi:putative ABC transport system ATP-binding protein